MTITNGTDIVPATHTGVSTTDKDTDHDRSTSPAMPAATGRGHSVATMSATSTDETTDEIHPEAALSDRVIERAVPSVGDGAVIGARTTSDSERSIPTVGDGAVTGERSIPSHGDAAVRSRSSAPFRAPSGASNDPAETAEQEREMERSTPATARIRALCDLLDNPDVTAPQVHQLLTDQGVRVSKGYVRKIVTEWKAEHAVSSPEDPERNERTADLPRLTEEQMARMEAEMAAMEAGMDARAPQAHPGERATGAPAGQVREVERSPERSTGARTSPKRSTSRAIVTGADSELAAEVARAKETVRWQNSPELMEALSEEEFRARREHAEWVRATRMQIERRTREAELARVERDLAAADAIAKAESKDARWHRRALAARRRLSNADARLAQLHRQAEWSTRALVGVVIVGMVWSGVNVQHNLVPDGDMHKMLYWLSYGLEAMISVPLIVVMIAAANAARWGKELNRGKVFFGELALLTVTVGLNSGPHLAAAHHGAPGAMGRAIEYAIAPVMVGVVIWLHSWASARYGELIEHAATVAERTTTQED